MVKQIVEFPSEHGPVRVEVEAPEGHGPQAVGRGDEVVETAKESFEDAVAGLRPVAESILAQIRELSAAPESVEVEFGVKLSGKLGIVLASSTAEAHCLIKLGWQRPSA